MAAPATSPDRLLSADDRRVPRKAVVDSGLVTVEMCPAGFGLMVNVSERGIAVYTMKNLTPAQDVQVSFMLPGSPRRIECNGIVRWAADSHAGLKLKEFDAQSLAAFKHWIATLPEASSAENPKLQRRPFPERDRQAREIESHVADERLQLDEALQFIVTRLLDLTHANGGAIALGDPVHMVCRASAGLAPEVGVPISSTSGATGECIRTGKEIYCEDTELDARVDREACRALNLRSSLIVPVLHQNKVAGVLEAFSPIPAAFQEDHRWLVNRLAELTARLAYESTSERASTVAISSDYVIAAVATREPEAPTAIVTPVGKPAETPVEAIVRKHTSQRTLTARIKPFWPLSVFGGSVLLLALALHNSKPAVSASVSAPPAPLAADAAELPSKPTIIASQQVTTAPAKAATTTAPRVEEAGSKSGHEPTTSPVMTLPPSTSTHESDSQSETAPAVQLASAAALPNLAVPATTDKPELLNTSTVSGGEVVHQVQPIYPTLALQTGRQGDVVLRAHINKHGKVTKIKVVSGDPLLANAAMVAVREWRYQPFERDDLPQEMDSTITLKFRAPKR